ncbi:MAG: tRNA threonylcarbamoyladenosine dehydratase [Deltaproteobacteria bacterium]|nr:tRNA threonylcarbamoyladenosine dehydratase [Deltaproteobacteria bacterium]
MEEHSTDWLRASAATDLAQTETPIASDFKLHRRFDRAARLLTERGLERLADAHVMVVGCGGVGSFAAESLARSGVGHISLVDFDLVCVTNTNRQLHAMRGQIGKAKVEVMAERLRLVHPQGRIDARVAFYSADEADALLVPKPDFVIDAIDNLTAKAHLIARCLEEKIPVVACMGAAARMDPTRVQIDDLARTHHDPMASAFRGILREKYGLRMDRRESVGVLAVFSDEHPIAPSPISYDAEEGFHCVCPQSDNDKHTCEKRSRIDGSVSWVTGTFGLVAASVAVRSLLGQPVIATRSGARRA